MVDSCGNKPGLDYDEVSDQGVGSQLAVDFLDVIIGDVRVGAGQESRSTDLKDWMLPDNTLVSINYLLMSNSKPYLFPWSPSLLESSKVSRMM